MKWRERIGKAIGHLLYRVIVLLGHQPKWLHYYYAEGFSFLLQYVIKYRRRVVEQQLRRSFPQANDNEIKRYIHSFYEYLGDLLVEFFRMAAFSSEDLHRHLKLEGEEQIKRLHEQGYSTIYLALGHYANWEWLTGLQCYLDFTHLHVLYKSQGIIMDEIMRRVRGRFGTDMLEKDRAPREILGLKNQPGNHIIAFVADQTPSPRNIHLFMPFLNRETAVFTGLERLSRKTHSPVGYIDIIRNDRGSYTCRVQILTEDASLLPEGEVSYRFMKEMEQTILRQPGYWLWSHRRWKHAYKDITQRYPNQRVHFRE